MRALVLTEKLHFDPAYAQPKPALGEALVKVTKAGVCNTDIELQRGYFGFRGVPGHEFVGVIEETETQNDIAYGAGAMFKKGDRVVGEINCVPLQSQSRNYFERAQDPTRCTLGIDRHDGAFADYVTIPLVNLHHVPANICDDEAVFVEPLAAACQILEQVHIKSTDRVYVIGDGKLGLLCAQVLATTGCALTAVGKHANKLDILAQRGISIATVGAMQIARDADIVVECTGSPTGFEMARQLLRPRGTLILKSTYHGLPQVNLTMIVVDEITIVGSRCGPFNSALRLLAQKRVDVLPLIHARFALEEGVAAFEHAQNPGVLKVMIDINA
jgi:threonine dehydrogenase-like Zn-dependent dehydrogenase